LKKEKVIIYKSNMSGFPAPSDGSIPNSIINGVDQIRLTQWHFDMYGTRYLEEITRGIAYGTQDSRFSSSGLLNITLANVESYAQQHIQCLQTLIANKNLLVASGTANTITLSTRVIDDSLESGTYAKNAPLPLNFRNGLELDFVAIADNTGAVTISIPDFQGVNGALNLVKQDFSALTSGDIKAGYRYTIICDSTNNRFILKDTFVRQATETLGGIAKISTTAQVNTGTNDLTFITPLKLKQYITSITGSSRGTSGYTYLPNGLILNWGTTSTTVGNSATNTVVMNFALPFPTAGIHAFSCVTNAQGGCQIGSTIISTTQASVTYANLSGSTKSFTGITLAIGY